MEEKKGKVEKGNVKVKKRVGKEKDEGMGHCDLKVLRSQAKIDENFANYFLKNQS